MNWFRKMVAFIAGSFLVEKEPLFADPPDNYYQSVKQAWQEWQDAKQRFNQVSDPGMVDYAVYALQAAERRYVYLLQKAKQELSSPIQGGTAPGKK